MPDTMITLLRPQAVLLATALVMGCGASPSPDEPAAPATSPAAEPRPAPASETREAGPAGHGSGHAGMHGGIATASNASVEETVERLQSAIEAKGLSLFATIDHAANAGKAGLELRPTVVVIFGNPKIGTQLMQEAPTLGINLPMKILVYRDDHGQVQVVHEDPAHLARRHGLEGQDQLLAKVSKALSGLSRQAAGAQP